MTRNMPNSRRRRRVLDRMLGAVKVAVGTTLGDLRLEHDGRTQLAHARTGGR
jgi:hypothetical protein